jgi:hypothetical protein
MTYLELVQRLQSESGAGGNPIQSLTGLRGTSARLVTWVREADLLLQHRWTDWKFLFAVSEAIVTADGARDYAGNADLNQWVRDSLRINGQPLELREYNSALVDDGAKGEPVMAYMLPNRQLRLYPTPDAAYTITGEYYRRPVPMSGAAAQSIIPLQFHEAIVWQGLWLYANFENAQESKVQAQEMLSQYLVTMEAQELPHGQGHKMASAGVFVVRPQ